MARIDEIRTKKLVLRRLVPGDAERIHALITDWDVMRMLARPPYPYGLDDARAYLAKAKDYPWEFAIAGEGLMGVIGITGHLGYWLGRPYWGHGYMTEAATGLLDTYFAKARGNVVSGAFRDNPGSRRVLAKLGFRQTGISRIHCNARGAEVDHLDMVLTRADWQARSAKLDAAAMERD